MPFDTSPDAARIQNEIYRGMGAPKRLQIACELSEAVRELACTRIRAQHPEFDEIAVRAQLIWELYGVRRQS